MRRAKARRTRLFRVRLFEHAVYEISLAEIAAVRGRLGLPVERDRHFTADKPLSAYADEARRAGRIAA